jgi:hypothetical protein
MSGKPLEDRLARPLLELLEHRRLLSANIVANDDLLVFNDPVGGGYSPTQAVVVTNSGTSPLIIPQDGVRVVGSHPQNFVVTYHPSLPATLAPGESVQVRAAFRATGLGIRHAQLQIQSNDPDTQILAVSLRGLGTQGLFSSAEPSLQRILQVHDIPVRVGDANPDNSIIQPPEIGAETIHAPFSARSAPVR